MTYKEIYDVLNQSANKCFIVAALCDIKQYKSGAWQMELRECVTMGKHFRDQALIDDALHAFEFEGIDQEGLWEIDTLLVYEPKSEKDDEYLFIGYSEVKFIR